MTTERTMITASSHRTPRILGVCATLCTLVLGVACLTTIISFAATGSVGGELYTLRKKTAQLSEQNKKITAQIASLQSLQSLYEKAVAQGYIPTTHLTTVQLKDTKVALDIVR